MGLNANSRIPDLLSLSSWVDHWRRNTGAGFLQFFDGLTTNSFDEPRPASASWHRRPDIGNCFGLSFHPVPAILLLPTGSAARERNDVRLSGDHGLQLCNRFGSISFRQPFIARINDGLDRSVPTQCLSLLRLRTCGSLDGFNCSEKAKRSLV